MLRKLMLPLVAVLVLVGCGEGPTVPLAEDPDGDLIEWNENGERIYK